MLKKKAKPKDEFVIPEVKAKKKKPKVTVLTTEEPVKKKVKSKKIADTTVNSSKVKKKKKPSTALSVVNPKVVVLHKPSGESVSDSEFKDILSSSANEVYKLLEINDTDSAVQLLYKRVIQSSYQMLGKIEQSMQEGSGTRGAYPFNAVASTLRDYLVDLQSSLDKSRLAETIIDNIMRPMFREMASQLVIEMGIISKEAKMLMDEKNYEDFNANVVRNSQSKVLQTMERCYHIAIDDARKALG